MRYEVEIGGVSRDVTLVRTGGGFAVTLGDRTFQIDATRIDGHTLSLLVDRVWPDDTVRPQSDSSQTAVRLRTVHDVTVVPAADGMVTVRVGTTPIAASVDGRRRLRAGGVAADGQSGPQRVVAPMPGKVVRVLAAAGDTVRARQPIVVVEAMKMENELRAARDGTLVEVHAREGLLVEAGALLAVIQ